MDAKALGQRLYELRTQAGLTQQELAEKVGVTPSAISKIENGRQFPQLENLEAWVEACGHKLALMFPTEGREVTTIVVENDFVPVVERFSGLSDESRQLVEMLIEALPNLPYESRGILRSQFDILARGTLAKRVEDPDEPIRGRKG
jgi:transcriptional regulator with XRE-family HTH domain